jgi:hypothetical protein
MSTEEDDTCTIPEDDTPDDASDHAPLDPEKDSVSGAPG